MTNNRGGSNGFRLWFFGCLLIVGVTVPTCCCGGFLTIGFFASWEEAKALDAADRQYDAGKYDEAVAVYKNRYASVSQYNPRKPEMVRRIVEHEMRQSNTQEASRWMEKALDDEIEVAYSDAAAKNLFAKVKEDRDKRIAQQQAEAARKAEEDAKKRAEARAKAEAEAKEARAKAEADAKEARAKAEAEAKRQTENNQKNVDEFIRRLAIAGLDRSLVRSASVKGSKATITVTRAWVASPKIDQEAAAKKVWQIWAAVGCPDNPSAAVLRIEDEDNNYVDEVTAR